MIEHVRRECSRRAVPPLADGALKRLARVVRLDVNLEVVAAGEGGLAVLAAVLFVTRVQFDVTIARPFVLEEAQTEIAPERHLVTVSLYRFN